VTGRGRFIVFEGIDGCGKSTQVARVAAARGAVSTFEPGDTDAGAALRAVVLDRSVTMSPLAEVLVMAADRAEHVHAVIEPALAAGRDVVCDRYSGSTLAYQGYGRGLDLAAIGSVLAVATGGLDPDVTIVLDCPVDAAAARRGRRTAAADRFEHEPGGFLEQVRAGFLAIAAGRESWHVIDATAPLVEVAAQVDAVLDGALR